MPTNEQTRKAAEVKAYVLRKTGCLDLEAALKKMRAEAGTLGRPAKKAPSIVYGDKYYLIRKTDNNKYAIKTAQKRAAVCLNQYRGTSRARV